MSIKSLSAQDMLGGVPDLGDVTDLFLESPSAAPVPGLEKGCKQTNRFS